MNYNYYNQALLIILIEFCTNIIFLTKCHFLCIIYKTVYLIYRNTLRDDACLLGGSLLEMMHILVLKPTPFPPLQRGNILKLRVLCAQNVYNFCFVRLLKL
jgi:hypothetical protein